LPFFFADYIWALPTFNNRGVDEREVGECFFVVGEVWAFGGEALAQVVDFVVVLLKKRWIICVIRLFLVT